MSSAPARTPTAFYWRARPNFGDLLTPLLLRHFADVEIGWSAIADADLVCVGSILESVPEGWRGIVAGSGMLHEGTVPHLKKATVLGVRGPLTAAAIAGQHKGDLVIGDPGLLADELVAVDKVYDLGLVPHWSDKALEHRQEFRRFKPHIIRPSGDPLQVIREIGRCRKIVTSSLHGVIVADSFGIPRRVEMAAQLVREGGDYKFRDYCASVSVPFELGLTQEAPRYKVQDRQQELYDLLVGLGLLLKKLR